MANWLEDMINRIQLAAGTSEYNNPGYTQNQRFDGGGPMYASGQDPAQYGVPYRAPYGEGQMMQHNDIKRSQPLIGDQRGPMDYEYLLGGPISNDTGSYLYGGELSRDIQGRANSAYPGIGFDGNDVRRAGGPADAKMVDSGGIIRALLLKSAEMAARENQVKNRGGK
jgi:hypothetical protein